jgi:hypothetical protein
VKSLEHPVHLGYEVGSGLPVEIPLAHTFVTGQTQLSGKTTALRAIVERSRRRALAFVTKRGEAFEGRPIYTRTVTRPRSARWCSCGRSIRQHSSGSRSV